MVTIKWRAVLIVFSIQCVVHINRKKMNDLPWHVPQKSVSFSQPDFKIFPF